MGQVILGSKIKNKRGMRQADNPETPVITLDVDPKEHSLVQYRGFANRSPDEDEMKFIKKWAKEKGLKVM